MKFTATPKAPDQSTWTAPGIEVFANRLEYATANSVRMKIVIHRVDWEWITITGTVGEKNAILAHRMLVDFMAMHENRIAFDMIEQFITGIGSALGERFTVTGE